MLAHRYGSWQLGVARINRNSTAFCGPDSGASLAQRCIASQAAPDDDGHDVSPAIALSQRRHAVFPSQEMADGFSSSYTIRHTNPGNGEAATAAATTNTAPTSNPIAMCRSVKIKQ